MFCPALHTLEGLSPTQAVEAVLAGYRGQDQVEGGVLLVALRSVFSTTIGRDLMRLCSHWSSSNEALLSLVERFRVLLAPAILCQKEPAHRIQSPY